MERIPAIHERVRVRDARSGNYIGHGNVIEHEPICSGFVAGKIAAIRMDDGSLRRVLYAPPPSVKVEKC